MEMETEEERKVRRRQQLEDMKKEKRRTERLYRAGAVAASVLAVLVGIGAGIGAAMFLHGHEAEQRQESSAGEDRSAAPGIIGTGVSGAAESNVIGEGNPAGAGMTGTGASGEGEAAEGDLLARGESPGEQDPSAAADGSDVPDTGRKRKGDRGRREEFDILRASRVIPISGAAVADIPDPEAEDSPQENMVSTAPEGDTVSAVPEEIPQNPAGAEKVHSPIWGAHETAETGNFGEEVISKYGILIDVWDGEILSEKRARERMNPASMTKVLTVLVAAEHLTEEDMDRTVQITQDITDYCFSNNCSIAGYDLNEEAAVRDLFYGTILPSGADAALALAEYVAGSHEAFVDMMNAKLEEMGLSGTTHFTNCVGLYDENHYSTVYDMAVILKTAADNPFCRDVLSRQIYYTVPTQEHPEGLMLVNWFLRRIEDRDTHGTVLCAKTGFIDEAGSCAASLSVGDNGREYICVTGASSGAWDCIADQEILYRTFLPQGQQVTE